MSPAHWRSSIQIFVSEARYVTHLFPKMLHVSLEYLDINCGISYAMPVLSLELCIEVHDESGSLFL